MYLVACVARIPCLAVLSDRSVSCEWLRGRNLLRTCVLNVA